MTGHRSASSGGIVSVSAEHRRLAKVLWDYHCVGEEPLAPADFALALGSHDLTVAQRAGNLVASGLVPLLVVSGGRGKVTRDVMAAGDTESGLFFAAAVAAGAEAYKVVEEPTATNTGENVTRTRALLDRLGHAPRNGILVAKPYMRRRALATATCQWSQVAWQVTSPLTSYDDYVSGGDERRTIELMVGDLQRIRTYAQAGFQTEQPMPEHVWDSYRQLVAAGFDLHVHA